MQPKEVRKKWAENLRSGKYAQGQGMLNNSGKNFCCLGVLCEMAVDEGLLVRGDESGTYVNYWRASGDRFSSKDASNTGLPQNVVEWAGLCDFSGTYRDENNALTSLIQANDSGKTFNEIADIIEAEPKGLICN